MTDNVIELQNYFSKRYTPGDWFEDELADGASMEEVLELFQLSPGEVFEFLLNSGMIDEDILIELLELR